MRPLLQPRPGSISPLPPLHPLTLLLLPSDFTELPGGQTLSLQPAARSPADVPPPSRTRLGLTQTSSSSREANTSGGDGQEHRPVQTRARLRALLPAESVTPSTSTQHRQVQSVYVPNVMGLFYSDAKPKILLPYRDQYITRS